MPPYFLEGSSIRSKYVANSVPEYVIFGNLGDVHDIFGQKSNFMV